MDNLESSVETILERVCFNKDGLIPVIAQQIGSNEVLMMAWMNREALVETISSARACYWSRSRGALWRKGETSGQGQVVKRILVDCDGDTILLQVDQDGVACHTGHRSCFYTEISQDGGIREIAPVLVNPDNLYRQ